MTPGKAAHQISTRVGVVAENHPGYVEALFTSMETGAVGVPLREANDFQRIQAAGVERIISSTPESAWMTRAFQSPASDAIALISFTSGTEGQPKGVMLSHNNLHNVVQRLNAVMQVDESISEYVGVPVYHSFGFGRCRAVAAVGGRVFIPGNGFNPAEIGAMLRQGEINAISAVPSLWRILLANQDLIGAAGRKVRWIEIGSQYMSRAEKEAMKALFPEARIIQHYGLTEASRTTFLEIHREEGDALESVGRALHGVSIEVTASGQIAILGEHVAQNYLIEGELVKLREPNDWFITKDLGRLQNGYLYYKGRADDMINCGGIKVSPETLETKIYARIGYSNSLAICRKADPVRGEGFLVAVTKDVTLNQKELRDIVSEVTQEFGINAGNSIAIAEIESLPKTPSGKIQRKKLEEWYGSQIQDRIDQPHPQSSHSNELQKTFCTVLGIPSVQPQDNFISLGGDSLSYVQISMELEKFLGYLPDSWERKSIAELEQLIPNQEKRPTIETNILFRALSICEVVTHHANLTSLGGGAFFLLLIAGANFARFQGGALAQGNFLKPVLSLLKNLIIPYFIICLAYQIHKREFDLSVLFLFSNFVSPNVVSIFPVWFINTLVQSITIFSLLFCFRGTRQFATKTPWGFGLFTLALGIFSNQLGPYVWDANYLYNRVPHMLIWIFALGWCIHFAQSKLQKAVTTGLLVATSGTLIGFDDPQSYLMLVGGIAIIWVKLVRVPSLLKTPIQLIGASAYYIYLTHMIFIHIITDGLKVENPWVSSIFAIAGGVCVWIGVKESPKWTNKLTKLIPFSSQLPWKKRAKVTSGTQQTTEPEKVLVKSK
jgi:acyl-CoA synthetase (AMP-forming)/AMP-acid ligase II/acyl carrier protein